MKMVKKILLGMVAVAAVLSFAGCKMGAGEGETDGNKWDLTMTVDTTDPKKPMTANTTYRRFWEQISASEKVAAITTTITIDPAKCTYVDTTSALVAGLIFDCNKNATDDKKSDFNLIGINPKRNNGQPQYYIERYEGVDNDKKKSGDSNVGSLGTAVEPLPTMEWANMTTSMYSTDANGVMSFKIQIKQENKTYKIYIGDTLVKSVTSSRTTNLYTKDNVEYLCGGIACYGNASTGNKVVANYKSEKASVIGKLEAEEIEE